MVGIPKEFTRGPEDKKLDNHTGEESIVSLRNDEKFGFLEATKKAIVFPLRVVGTLLRIIPGLFGKGKFSPFLYC